MPLSLTTDKTIDILEAVASSREGVGTRELARRLDLNVATVHNIAKTLEGRGYLRQSEETRRFTPGLRLMMLGCHDRRLEWMTTLAEPFVNEVAAELDESVMLGVLDHGRVLNLHYVPSRQALRVHEPEDVGFIAHCTALGKLMLASMPPDQLEAYLDRTPLERFTDRTITSRAQLMQELDTIRKRGFSETRDELCEGVSAIGVAVMDPWGAAAAARGASAPTIRMRSPAQWERTLASLQVAARRIGQAWSHEP